MHPRITFCLCLLFSLPPPSLKAEANWSVELLKEVLETRGRAGQETGERGSGELAQEGLVLRSYQLKHLRVGESARGKSALQLLTRLLPPGSTIKVDTPANSIHLLASISAQAAAWDFLSSLDIPSENAQVGLKDLSPTLQSVLQKLDAAQSNNARLAEAVARIEAELQNETRREGREKERRNLWPYPVAGLCLLGGLVFWQFNRTEKRRALLALEQGEKKLSLAPHELLGGQLKHQQQQRELQQEMLGAINAAAIRMELLYNEQVAHREQITKSIGDQEHALRLAQSSFLQAKEQLLSENQSLLEKAGTRFEASAQSLDNNVRQLGKQQERVEALAGELQTTVQELDETKDEIIRLQSLLEKRGDELDQARERLSHREGELCHQQAKLAALTLLLEEGHWPEEDSQQKNSQDQPTKPEEADRTNQGEGPETVPREATPAFGPYGQEPEPMHVLPKTESSTEALRKAEDAPKIKEPRNPQPCLQTPAPICFQFLPPEAPET